MFDVNNERSLRFQAYRAWRGGGKCNKEKREITVLNQKDLFSCNNSQQKLLAISFTIQKY